MHLQDLLIYFFFIPLLGYIFSVLISKKRESALALTAIITSGVQLFGTIVFGAFWISNGQITLDIKQITILKTPDFDFYIAFIFDQNSFIYLLVGSVLTLLVSVFSKYYIHREQGFKKYFNNVQLFFVGYSVVVIAGNLYHVF